MLMASKANSIELLVCSTKRPFTTMTDLTLALSPIVSTLLISFQTNLTRMKDDEPSALGHGISHNLSPLETDLAGKVGHCAFHL